MTQEELTIGMNKNTLSSFKHAKIDLNKTIEYGFINEKLNNERIRCVENLIENFMKVRRKFIMENQEINADSNISLNNIYKAIGYIKPEHQAYILANYKLTELYNIFANNERYDQYIRDLFAVSNEYINRATALSILHTEAFLHSMREKQEGEFDPAATMCQIFDCMSEADQKRFCEGMFQKKGFFEDAYKNMMDAFQNATSNE